MIGLYFSGTGNTAYCIKQYMKELQCEHACYSIEQDTWKNAIKESETIIFAYPIFYSNLPKIVQDFIINHHDLWGGKQIFIITTMGLFSGDGAGCSARMFQHYGATIIGGLHLKMPDSIGDEKLLKKSLEKNQEIIAHSMNKLRNAAIAHKQGKPAQEGLSFFSHILGLFGQRLWFSNKTSSYTNRLNIHQKQCVGCGLCTSLCPMNNICLKDGKAVANDHCTMCYRCINHCPKQAITLLGKKVYQQSLIEHFIKEKV